MLAKNSSPRNEKSPYEEERWVNYQAVFSPSETSIYGRFEKWLMWKCQDFQANLLLTHKSKTIGTIFVAL